ncbi:ABC transporter permease [Porticoccus sp.]|uniref:ABC transporter permease n=1 Tax=Porticoccus sp. TaxID=2024853 RepID=UPI003F69742A
MLLWDQIGFNGQIFLRHRVRTGLLLLAVGLGVASVILLTSLGEGARRYVDREFAALGNQLLVVLPGRKETTGGAPPMYGAAPRDLTLEDAWALERIPSVRAVAPVIAGTAQVSLASRSREVIVLGSTPAIFQVRRMLVAQGNILPERSRAAAMAVCVLGAKLKQELFGNRRAIGEWVRVGDRRMRVIGVLESRGESLGLDLRDMIIVPVRTAEQMFNSPGLFRILMELDDNADFSKVEQRIRAIIIERHEGDDDVTLISEDAILAAFDNIFTTLTLAIAAIAAISLLVAGILIMNISLVSVSQRRREIGLLKALGGSSRQVRQLFLGESLLLVSLGSLAGIAAAWLAVLLLGRLWPVFPLTPPWWSMPAAVGTALLAGLLFSLLPARRAAALDPVLALRGQDQ